VSEARRCGMAIFARVASAAPQINAIRMKKCRQ